jgi:fatty acid CoA ligase FadD36/malonyl-CoA/methylmalonyl-CoA synthetase
VLTALHDGRADVSVGGLRLQGDELSRAVGAVAGEVSGARRVAVVMTPGIEAAVLVAGALAAGCCVVPVNPAAGPVERGHVLADAKPDLVLDASVVDLGRSGDLPAAPAVDSSPALVVYTSGTTGAPKGAVLSRRAVVACLDGLSDRWQLSPADVLAHALPLFHVHGLVLGTLGPLRAGMRLVVTERLGPVSGASVYYAVPTAWGRLADGELRGLRDARLLVSGSAPLPAPVYDQVRQRTGQPLVERYGLTESLIVTAATAESAAPGQVGQPLDGVAVRIAGADDDGMGEVQLRGPTLFDGYLGRPEATSRAWTADGWFRTGDLGRYDATTGLRLLGRIATDLIKTGGFKVGAGEVEDALLTHPAVGEAAVVGVPDDDLGERIVAYGVCADPADAGVLIDHVARQLTPHKRPREIRFVDTLPRNAMGKIVKSRLSDPSREPA